MATQKKNNIKKKRRRLKPVPILVLVTVLIGIIISLVLVFGEKPKKESVNVSISDAGVGSNTSDEKTSNTLLDTTVSIDMDSCAIPIGTILKVTASIDPVEVEKTINWSSSDENVFTVDSEGIIIIKGKGTSALTATLGSTSDAIVIEGILNNDTAKSQNDLPIFNLIASSATSSNGTLSNGTSISGTSNNSSTVNNTGNTTNPVSNNTNNPGGTNNTGNNGNSSNPVNPDSGTNNGTNSGTNSGLKSTELNGSLNEFGYSKVLSNVYVYQENNTYYGEIVIQSNVTIIYIKQRCEGYDMKIKQVIASLLPIENAQVWSNYIAASSDRTFTVEGRMVRIVTAFNGGHSQIVIYN